MPTPWLQRMQAVPWVSSPSTSPDYSRSANNPPCGLRQAQAAPSPSSLRPRSGSTPSEVEGSRGGLRPRLQERGFAQG